MSSFTALIKGGRGGGTNDTKGVAYLLEEESPRLGLGLLTFRNF